MGKRANINQEEVQDNFVVQEEHPIDDLMPTEEVEVEIPDPDAPYTYLKKSVPGYYVEMPKKLKEEQFNNLGESLEDFHADKWVLLSKEQVQFHIDNPTASIKEVFDMELRNETYKELSEEELLLRAKQEKLHELDIYDNSSEVNEFTINGETKAWFTPDQRANYKNSIDSAKLLNVGTLQLLIDKQVIELSTDKAAQILAMIQLYADSCYIVTKQHENAIQALETVEEVEAYDFTQGYPDKLNFDL